MSNKDERYDKLDNTANLFPMIVSESMSNVYRISVTLKYEIVPDILQKALDKVLPYFDVFNSKMTEGLFWYYFETNHNMPPQVEEESTYPCRYINPHTNRDYLFRVSYYKNRINLEVFHAVTDGNGALAFLKEITYQYLRDRYPELKAANHDILSPETSLDREDSYVKNFKKSKKKKYKKEKAFIIEGEKLPENEIGVIHGYINIKDIKTVSKKYGVTINQYLIGTFAWAVYKECMKSQAGKKPFSACVPVNLRPYFDSGTLKNFFAIVSATFRPTKDSYTFDEVLEEVADSLRRQITKENLEDIIAYNVSNEENKWLRAVPLFIKRAVMKRIYLSSAKANTTTVTNLGVISISPGYEDYIEKFTAVLSMSPGQNIKATVFSYRDTLAFTFCSSILETNVQRAFFRHMVEDGINVTVESNGAYYE